MARKNRGSSSPHSRGGAPPKHVPNACGATPLSAGAGRSGAPPVERGELQTVKLALCHTTTSPANRACATCAAVHRRKLPAPVGSWCTARICHAILVYSLPAACHCNLNRQTARWHAPSPLNADGPDLFEHQVAHASPLAAAARARLCSMRVGWPCRSRHRHASQLYMTSVTDVVVRTPSSKPTRPLLL